MIILAHAPMKPAVPPDGQYMGFWEAGTINFYVENELWSASSGDILTKSEKRIVVRVEGGKVAFVLDVPGPVEPVDTEANNWLNTSTWNGL